MHRSKLIRSLLASALVLGSVVTGHSQVVTPNPAPTIITTAPYTITKPGYYQLGADLYYGGNPNIPYDAIITIAAGNVTLDFGGHYISGPSSAPNTSLVGVYAYERGNLTIQNGTIAYCLFGVWLNGSGNSGSTNINQQVRNLLISYCYNIGIHLDKASNCLLSNNRISFIGGSTFTNGPSSGVELDGGTLNKVSGNIISNVSTSINDSFGIYCNGGAVIASGNDISNIITYAPPLSAYGIYNPTIAVGNTVSNCQYGINGGKYQNNLSSGCTTPFSGGTDAGGNN